MTYTHTSLGSGSASAELGRELARLAGRYRRAADALCGPNAAAMADLLQRLSHETAALTGGPTLDPPHDGDLSTEETNASAALAQEAARVAGMARAAGQDSIADTLERQEASIEAQFAGK